ncbi:MAG TPA: hypothetical protein VFD47_12190 [Actinomycetota bacterium]|nr:hypothetical protein [Actinomycetota bacterium]
MSFDVLGDLNWLAVIVATDTVAEGIVLGLVTGVGIALSALFVTGFFDPQKPQAAVWVAVVSGYHVVGLVIAAIILAIWT